MISFLMKMDLTSINSCLTGIKNNKSTDPKLVKKLEARLNKKDYLEERNIAISELIAVGIYEKEEDFIGMDIKDLQTILEQIKKNKFVS